MSLFRRRRQGPSLPDYPRAGNGICNPLVCSSEGCGRPPFIHIALGVNEVTGDLDVSQACSRCWREYARHVFKPEHVHLFGPPCGMPGTAWDWDHKRCIQGELETTAERDVSEAERLIESAFS